MLTEALTNEIVLCGQKYYLGFLKNWDQTLPHGSIVFRQLDSNTIGVRIFIPNSDGFSKYEKIRDELKTIFSKHDIFFDFNGEKNESTKLGWNNELHFINKESYQEKCNKGKVAEAMSAGTIINITTLNAQGGNTVFGNIIDSKLIIDNSVKEIRDMIDEKGGEDKDELLGILEEVKLAAEQIIATKKIEDKPNLKERISKNIEKHRWFYSGVIALLGKVAFQLLFPSAT